MPGRVRGWRGVEHLTQMFKEIRMPTTQINCPNCRQPVVADVQQLFDVNVDPAVKQQILSGAFNLVRCPHCGYQGNLATPIVYHDPHKELLLTFVPPELGFPRDEQERLIGSLINRVVNDLPQEQRRGYLFRPHAHLTTQGLIERILEGEGITREMIQAQQQRVNLIQRLLSLTDPQVRAEVLRQDEGLIDNEFFRLFSRLLESAVVSGDQESARRLEELQADLLENTEYGRQFKEQAEEVQAAVASLQEAGKDGLTREKLLELITQAPNETRLSALVSLARPAMDYAFFQLLSQRIDRARDKGRERLIDLRERLLELTRQIDEQIEARAHEARQVLESIIQAPDISEAIMQNLAAIDEFFVQVLNSEMEAARKAGDLERSAKLQQISDTLQQASAPPAEIALIEQLLDAKDEEARRTLLEQHRQEITPEFLQTLSALVTQVQQSGQDAELLDRLQKLHKQAMRFSMMANLRGS